MGEELAVLQTRLGIGGKGVRGAGQRCVSGGSWMISFPQDGLCWEVSQGTRGCICRWGGEGEALSRKHLRGTLSFRKGGSANLLG